MKMSIRNDNLRHRLDRLDIGMEGTQESLLSIRNDNLRHRLDRLDIGMEGTQESLLSPWLFQLWWATYSSLKP